MNGFSADFQLARQSGGVGIFAGLDGLMNFEHPLQGRAGMQGRSTSRIHLITAELSDTRLQTGLSAAQMNDELNGLNQFGDVRLQKALL